MNNVIDLFNLEQKLFENLPQKSQDKLDEIWYNDYNKQNDLDNVYNFDKTEIPF